MKPRVRFRALALVARFAAMLAVGAIASCDANDDGSGDNSDEDIEDGGGNGEDGGARGERDAGAGGSSADDDDGADDDVDGAGGTDVDGAGGTNVDGAGGTDVDGGGESQGDAGGSSVEGDAGEGTAIGPEGGEVISDDGLLTLTIPAGALLETHEIRISHTSSQDLEELIGASIETAYELEPDGLEFAEPATFAIRLPHEVGVAPGSITSGARNIWLNSAGGIEPILEQRVSVDPAEQSADISGSIEHFSTLEFETTDPFVSTEAKVEYPESICVGETGTIDLTLSSFPARLDRPSGPFPLDYRFSPDQAPSWEVAPTDVPTVQIDGGRFERPLSNLDDDSLTVRFLATCDGAPGTLSRLFRIGVPFVVIVDGQAGPPRIVEFEMPVQFTCEPCDDTQGLTPGSFATLASPESAVVVPDGFAQIDGPHLLAAGAGTAIHAQDGTRVKDFEDAAVQLYNAEPITWDAADGPRQSIFSVGPEGFTDRTYVESQADFSQFMFLGEIGNNITAFHPIPSIDDPNLTAAILIANNSTGDALRVLPDNSVDETPVLSGADIAMAGIPGILVDLIPTTDGSTYFGTTNQQPFVVVSGSITAVGDQDIAGGYRLLDCDASLCAVASFGLSAVTSFFLDTNGNAQLPVDTQPVDGPVGVDVEGERIAAAGFNDHNLVLIERSPSEATMLSTLDVSADCSNPSNPRIIPLDGGMSFQLVTNCNGNNRVLITESDPF